jgi:hypothetical protein
MSTVVLLHYNPASPISLPGGPVVGLELRTHEQGLVTAG